MIRKLILSIAVLMLAVSTTVAQPTATNFGVNDAQGNQNTFVLVPVNITNTQDGPIAGIIFDVSFNSSVINLTSARVTRGSLTSAWDAPSFGQANGRISIPFGGSGTEIPDGSSGSVVILNFSVIGAAGATSNMNITRIQLSDPDGNVGAAPAKNGTFTVTSPPTTGTIVGSIAYSNNGTWIPGVSVNLTNASGVIASTITDASGNYNFTNVIPGSYNVNASKPLFIGNSTGVVVTAGSTSTVNLVLSLAPVTGTIVGSIAYSNNGTWIPGVTVNLTNASGVIATTITDASGNYNFTNVIPGSYNVNASKPLFIGNSAGVVVTAGSTSTINLVLSLVPGTIVGSIAYSNNGTWILGVTVNLTNASGVIASTITDASGNYNFTNVIPGSYNVNASKPLFIGNSTGVVVTAGSTSTVNLVLSLISGTVAGNIAYSNNGTGIPGVTVNLTNASGVIASTTTDASGNYSFTNVIPSNYNVNTSKLQFFANSTGDVVVTAGSTSNVNQILWMKGDLNNNGIPADAGDLVLMKRAAIGEIPADFRYDLNNNGIPADAGDLVLMKRAAIGEIILI